jgi:hypothetical protein
MIGRESDARTDHDVLLLRPLINHTKTKDPFSQYLASSCIFKGDRAFQPNPERSNRNAVFAFLWKIPPW